MRSNSATVTFAGAASMPQSVRVTWNDSCKAGGDWPLATQTARWPRSAFLLAASKRKRCASDSKSTYPRETLREHAAALQ